MAKYTEIETKCACGEKIKAQIAKPNRFQPTISPASCSRCGSRYRISFHLKEDSQPREYFATIQIVYLSDKARAFIQYKLDQAQKG